MAPESPSPLAHTRSRFEFAVAAPYAIVAPLFGAAAERKWGGPEWDPRFLHPETPRDTQGMVFTLDRHAHRSVWVQNVSRSARPGGRRATRRKGVTEP